MTRRATGRTRTFVSLTGPADNIGDALLRRATLEWARGTSEQLVAYTGIAPDIWLDQLGIPSDTVLLRSKRSIPRWLWLLLTAPARPVLVFEAGEIPLDRGNVLRELVFVAETLIVRLKRGVVVRPPRGIRAATRAAARIHAIGARLSQITLWRDAVSAGIVRTGCVAPDLGFGAGIRSGVPWDDRHELIVSLRGARPFPDESWIAAVRATAVRERLRIRTVVQVREDENRSRELAAALGGEVDVWGTRSAVDQEKRLRDRYDGARIVISDRLHVLILAALSGAVPVEVVARPTGKITGALATIGLAGVSLDTTVDSDRIEQFLSAQLTRSDEVRRLVTAAARRVSRLQREVGTAIRHVRS